MKKLIIAATALLVTTVANNVSAQNAILDQNPWSVGAGWDFIANNGYRDHQFLKIPTWSDVAYPCTIDVSRTLGWGFSIEASFSYAKEMAGQVVDKEINPVNETYYMYDLLFKYNLHAFFNNSKFVLQPYVLFGPGLNYVTPYLASEGDPNDKGSIYPPFIFRNLHCFASVDMGIGVDISLHNMFPTSKSGFCKRISIELQAMGRWTDDANDFIQYQATIQYRLPTRVDRPQLL